MNPKVIKVSNFDAFENAISKMEYRYWVFRGQSDISWRIEPTLARYYRSHQGNIRATSFYPRESDSIEKFRKSAHLHLRHLPANSDPLEWLAVMQHFGAPTRLIDFTFSPYAALFFALERSSSEIAFGAHMSPSKIDSMYRPYVVHAVHLQSVRLRAKKFIGHPGLPDPSEYMIGKTPKHGKSFVGFFEGSWKNQRQVAQQGLFMVPSMIDMDVEHYLKSCPSSSKDFPKSSWIKFQFLGGLSEYSEMVKRLFRANVTAEALFPGLEGTARSISMGFYAPKIALR
jgi:hypothetical protein